MKHKLLIRKQRLPIYGSSLWIVVSNSLSKAIDQVEDLIDYKVISDEWKGSTRAYMFAYVTTTGRQKFILFLNPNSKPGEIAHESKHLVNTAYLWNNVKLSLTNDEPECYYLENIVNSVHLAIKSYNKQFNPPRSKNRPY